LTCVMARILARVVAGVLARILTRIMARNMTGDMTGGIGPRGGYLRNLHDFTPRSAIKQGSKTNS
jgi:hypothetical protein